MCLIPLQLAVLILTENICLDRLERRVVRQCLFEDNSHPLVGKVMRRIVLSYATKGVRLLPTEALSISYRPKSTIGKTIRLSYLPPT
jgi:hypothetical protein